MLQSNQRIMRAAVRAEPESSEVVGRALLAARARYPISIHHHVVAQPPHQIGEVFTAVLSDEATGGAIKEAAHRNGDPLAVIPPFEHSREIVRAPEIRRPVLFAGLLFHHYGHFMLESLGRLWAYPLVRSLDPYIVFGAPWGVPNYFERDHFTNKVFTGLGIPLDRIVIADGPIRLPTVVIPEQLYGYHTFGEPHHEWMRFVRGFRYRPQIPRGFERAERLYVSRSRLPASSGRPIAERQFEEYLTDNRYTVVHPEYLSLDEQLTLYERADRIVFCDGSALHTCVLLPNLTAELAIVARRRDPRWECSDVALQFTGYGHNVVWIDAVRQQYQVGLDTWNALGDVDWYDVSVHLHEARFVDTVFDGVHKLDHCELARIDINAFTDDAGVEPARFDYASPHPDAATTPLLQRRSTGRSGSGDLRVGGGT